MKGVPRIYSAEDLKQNPDGTGVSAGLPDGRWVRARPEGWAGLCLIERFSIAWRVFTGKLDALEWVEQ